MAYDFTNVKVLVVESSVAMFQLVKSVLSLLSVPDRNISAAYTIEEAFTKYCEGRHDIIISDWLKNPDHGIRLAKKIRTDKQSSNAYVPIIMTAGSGHYSRVIKARDAGISEYLVKPFSADDLAKRIVRVIEVPRVFVSSVNYTGPDRRVRDVPFKGPDRRKEKLDITNE